MTNHHAGEATDATLLANALTQRLNQLGISRRELVKRTGLSRQTIYNIEREMRTDLSPSTFAKLDRALYWHAGTAARLASGDASALHDADLQERDNLERAFRWTIVERIQRMTLEDLERLMSQLEGMEERESESLDDRIRRLERLLIERREREGL